MLPNVLLVYRSPSSFILQDRDLLARCTHVLEFRWTDHDHPARALAWTMFRQRRHYGLVLAWFGDHHASVATQVARWLRRPVVIVVGGYDLSTIPEYGFLSNPANIRIAERHFALAARIVPVSGPLRDELINRFPASAPKTMILPTGVDTVRFRPVEGRRAGVISVAVAESWPRALVKGWDRISDTAKRLPDVQFLLVGASKEVFERLDLPGNVVTKGPLPQERLIPLYQQSAVFLHPSRSEGLPNALLEAMSCGCVPVATSVGGVPEAVGDAGIVTSGEPEDLVEGVRSALSSPDLGPKARQRVEQSFSLARRERGLLGLLAEFA